MKNFFAGALAFAVLMTLGLAGCNDGGSGVVFSYYDYQGNYCGNSPYAGCTYRYDGSKVMVYEDPYYGFSNYQAGWGYCGVYDSYGCASYNYYWWSPNGVYYDAYGYALNSPSDQNGRDILADVAEQETAAIAQTGKTFAFKYGIAEDRAVQIIRDVRAWETFTQKNGRTAADYAEFSKRVFNVASGDVAAALAAAQKGDLAKLDAVNSQVAEYWGTDAETSKQILKDWYSKELGSLGIQ